MEPKTQIDLHITCLDNVGSGNFTMFYTGSHFGVPAQFGILPVHAYTGQGSIRNGFWRGDPGYCMGVARIYGDCHQTSHAVRASAGVEKWIISNGIGPSCTDQSGDRVSGLNVWKWNGQRFNWLGAIETLPRIDPNDSVQFLYLKGDYAYARDEAHHTWFRFDLNAMTYSTVGAPPDASEEQLDIAGHTYTFTKVEQGFYRFIRQDVAPPVELPLFCPKDYVSRQQVAAMIWKAVHPGEIPPPATGTVFSDVPATNIFAPYIEALDASGVVAGTPGPCKAPEDV